MRMTYACILSFILTTLLASCASQKDDAPVPDTQLEDLFQKIEVAADCLDPSEIKAILRQDGGVQDKIEAFDLALSKAPKPELVVDLSRNDLFVKLIAKKADPTSIDTARFDLWLDEFRFGDFESYGDIDGFKVSADTAELRAGEEREYLLNPFFVKSGVHRLYSQFTGLNGSLGGNIRLYIQPKDGDARVLLAERGFSTTDRNYLSRTPFVVVVSTGKDPGDGADALD